MREKPLMLISEYLTRDYINRAQKMREIEQRMHPDIVWADVFFWALIVLCLIVMALNWEGL